MWKNRYIYAETDSSEATAKMFCCLRNCFHGPLRKPTGLPQRVRPEIFLDTAHMGPDVVLLSNQQRITGTGGALATAPLVQSKSYFEVKIQQSGSWSVGLATRQADLTRKFGGGDKESWCLCSDNTTRHNNEEFRPVIIEQPDNTVPPIETELREPLDLSDMDTDILAKPKEHTFPDEGDVVGVAFDHIELNFYFNGKNLEVPFRNVKGDVYPVVFVGNGAILDIVFDNFHFNQPAGFQRIMLEQSLL